MVKVSVRNHYAVQVFWRDMHWETYLMVNHDAVVK